MRAHTSEAPEAALASPACLSLAIHRQPLRLWTSPETHMQQGACRFLPGALWTGTPQLPVATSPGWSPAYWSRPPRLWLCQHPAAEILSVSTSFFWNNFNYFQACNLVALTASTLFRNHHHYHPLSQLSPILNVSIP